MSKRKALSQPWVPSADYQRTAGRALMRWWNETGPRLPIEGEAFRGWWLDTMRALDSSAARVLPFSVRSDVMEQLQVYSQEAREWYDRAHRPGPPPPQFVRPGLPDVGVSSTAIVWGFVGLGVVFLLSRR